MPDGETKIKGIPAIEPIEDTFLDRNLRRIYLSDVPTALRGGIVPNGTGFPASPTIYQLFFRTDQGKMYIYNGANWLQILLLDTSGNSIIDGKYLKT